MENNPCFEIWLLMHFTFTEKLFSKCDEVVKELNKKNRIPGYIKNQSFLINAGLYKNYKGLIAENALIHSERLERDRKNKDDLYPRAQVYELFKWNINR